MEEKLKLSRQEIAEMVLHLDHYEQSFLKYKNLSQNSLTVLWLIYLLGAAGVGVWVPQIEHLLLIIMGISFIFLLKIMPLINHWIINFYLTKINKSFGKEVITYIKYHRIIKTCMVEALQEGSEGNYLQKVVIKTLARSL